LNPFGVLPGKNISNGDIEVYFQARLGSSDSVNLINCFELRDIAKEAASLSGQIRAKGSQTLRQCEINSAAVAKDLANAPESIRHPSICQPLLSPNLIHRALSGTIPDCDCCEAKWSLEQHWAENYLGQVT
jgi:hypothetical protein